jgi:hypothetical protein
MNAGTRMWGAYLKRSDTRPNSPSEGGTNTSSTVSLSAYATDPLARATRTTFYLDRLTLFNTSSLQTSAQVNGYGGQLATWASSAIPNFTWYWRARTSVSIGNGDATVGPYTTAISFQQAGGAGVPRSLYLYENKSMWARTPGVGSNARSLYGYVNKSIWPRQPAVGSNARDLYLYLNRAMPFPRVPAARSLYTYRNSRDGEVFPWLNHINPEEQYELGQVDLYGDGFGQYVEVAAGATITVDSTNGSYIKDYAVDRGVGSWISNSNQSGAWIRFTWGATKRIVAVALESASNGWGTPLFKFSAGADVVGGSGVPLGSNRNPEYPCGGTRTLYTFPEYRDTTYVEVRVNGGGGTSSIGFYEVWIYEEIVPAQNAEGARSVLNLGLLSEQSMGVVSWQNRSPNFWPANSGVAPLPAATVTVPSAAVSGLVNVEETT